MPAMYITNRGLEPIYKKVTPIDQQEKSKQSKENGRHLCVCVCVVLICYAQPY